jgi:hypothetical protein
VATQVERLSPGTRLARSWWIVLTLPLGFTTWAAFFYIGLWRRQRQWVVAGFVYLAALAAAMTYIGDHHGERGGLHTIASLTVLVIWVGGFVHALAVRSQVVGMDPALDSARGRLERRRTARRLALEDPALARELGIGRPDLPGSDHRGLVDINNANVAAIADVTGVDRALAEEIVAARERIDGFSSVEDMGTLLELPARTVERLSRKCICLPR